MLLSIVRSGEMRLQHLNYFNNICMYIFASQSEYSEHSESQGSPVSDGWEAGSTHNVIIMLLCSVLFLKIAKENVAFSWLTFVSELILY